MKKLPVILFAFSLSLGALHAQTTVPSYTNADLGTSPSGTANTNPAAIPGTNGGQTGAPEQTQQKKYPPLTAEQQQQFVQQMTSLVQAQEDRVRASVGKVANQSIMPNDWDRVMGEQTITNLYVKKTILEKFQDSPSIRSPLVRQVLIQVLSNDDIQPADLAQLQSVVDSERPYTYP